MKAQINIWYVDWTTFVRILKTIILIPNILTPHWVRLTHSEDAVTIMQNGPRIAISPSDMPLSLQRTDIIGSLSNFLFLFLDFCITIVTAYTVFPQSDQNLRCLKMFEIQGSLTEVCQ